MNTPVLLLRAGVGEEAEELVAHGHFPVYAQRAAIPAGSLVIPRYSALPYMDELERDVTLLGSRLINTFAQHRYVAGFEYLDDLGGDTFPTWFRYEDVPHGLRDLPFVVKGRTNSRKMEWHQKMFAPDFRAAVRIGSELATDGIIGQQGVVIRQYVPLETFELGVTGTPMANEWRTFYYRGERLCHGFYWSQLDDWTPVEPARADFEHRGLALTDDVARRVKDKIPLVVIDAAKTRDGDWKVVELNDGCQSGPQGCDVDELYSNLRDAL